MKAHKIPSLEPFNEFCLDEGAPYSIKRFKQFLACLSRFTLPEETHKLSQVQSSLISAKNGQHSARSQALKMLNIRFPLPNFADVLYQSFVIDNDIPVQLFSTYNASFILLLSRMTTRRKSSSGQLILNYHYSTKTVTSIKKDLLEDHSYSQQLNSCKSTVILVMRTQVLFSAPWEKLTLLKVNPLTSQNYKENHKIFQTLPTLC